MLNLLAGTIARPAPPRSPAYAYPTGPVRTSGERWIAAGPTGKPARDVAFQPQLAPAALLTGRSRRYSKPIGVEPSREDMRPLKFNSPCNDHTPKLESDESTACPEPPHG